MTATLNTIRITVNNDDVSSIAAFVADGLNKDTFRSFQVHGAVTASDVEVAFAQNEWLQKYLQTAINTALDKLPKSVLTERDEISRLPFDARRHVDGFVVGLAETCELPHFDDIPSGCYCSECHKEAVAQWSPRCDAFVPTCHPKGELTHDIAHNKTMENSDAVDYADDDSIRAWSDYCLDLLVTGRQHS